MKLGQMFEKKTFDFENAIFKDATYNYNRSIYSIAQIGFGDFILLTNCKCKHSILNRGGKSVHIERLNKTTIEEAKELVAFMKSPRYFITQGPKHAFSIMLGEEAVEWRTLELDAETVDISKCAFLSNDNDKEVLIPARVSFSSYVILAFTEGEVPLITWDKKAVNLNPCRMTKEDCCKLLGDDWAEYTLIQGHHDVKRHIVNQLDKDVPF